MKQKMGNVKMKTQVTPREQWGGGGGSAWEGNIKQKKRKYETENRKYETENGKYEVLK